MIKHITNITFFILAITCARGQQPDIPLLQSGPMPGYADMREAVIWLQTTGETSVYATYWDREHPEMIMRTGTVNTLKVEAHTAKLIADQVEPGRTYDYRLYFNDRPVDLPYPAVFKTPPLWKYRTNPPDFTILTGSCAYINQPEYDRSGKPYGGDYRIFTHMAAQNADLMLWLGDNVYLREPDWNTRTGFYKRYTHTRSLPELQAFLASTHHYAIWDDHDYGPDNCNKSFFNKNTALETFRLFWANPTFGTCSTDGITTSFQWGDVDFFLLDNRWFRDPDELNEEGKSIIGDDQMEWLTDNLVSSRATFKFVAIGGQFLSDAATAEMHSANGFDAEREKLISFIQNHQIKNVVFLTGDVHFSEISVLKAESKPAIYDFTFSTLSAGPNSSGESWKNTLRMPGTVVMDRNYGMISISGPAKARKLTVSCYDADNRKRWEKVIEQE
ncbi:MAG: alkaline phosphatase family protein [Bacteroidales bacterium]|nr:alkaline phosphatase family protein [Bacteroidales bacterium]